jgi:hypothetical protein
VLGRTREICEYIAKDSCIFRLVILFALKLLWPTEITHFGSIKICVPLRTKTGRRKPQSEQISFSVKAPKKPPK